MNVPREEQAQFAKTLLPLIENTKDINELEGLYKLVLLFKNWVGDEDNGIAFDLGEYLFETIQEAKGNEPSGWGESALASLKAQLDDDK